MGLRRIEQNNVFDLIMVLWDIKQIHNVLDVVIGKSDNPWPVSEIGHRFRYKLSIKIDTTWHDTNKCCDCGETLHIDINQARNRGNVNELFDVWVNCPSCWSDAVMETCDRVSRDIRVVLEQILSAKYIVLESKDNGCKTPERHHIKLNDSSEEWVLECEYEYEPNDWSRSPLDRIKLVISDVDSHITERRYETVNLLFY